MSDCQTLQSPSRALDFVVLSFVIFYVLCIIQGACRFPSFIYQRCIFFCLFWTVSYQDLLHNEIMKNRMVHSVVERTISLPFVFCFPQWNFKLHFYLLVKVNRSMCLITNDVECVCTVCLLFCNTASSKLRRSTICCIGLSFVFIRLDFRIFRDSQLKDFFLEILSSSFLVVRNTSSFQVVVLFD